MSTLKATFVSNWWGNPYKQQLISNLNQQSVRIDTLNFDSLYFLKYIFQKGKPNILHLHILQPFFMDGRSKIYTWVKLTIFLVQLFILKILGVKVVWTVHELNDPKLYGGGAIPTNIFRIVNVFLDSIITHCQFIKDEIVRLYNIKDTTKIVVVPHGNYIDSYPNNIDKLTAREKLGIPKDNTVFLFFGSLHKHKGIIDLVDAFTDNFLDKASLIIAGAPREEKLQQLIEDKIVDKPNILLIPETIPDEQVQIYMNASDCVVLPYKEFTTSGVLILAMSYGKACIAPHIGYFADLLDSQGAYLYDTENSEGLLSALKYALQDSHQLASMGEYNFQLAQQWNWSYVANQTLNVYKWCLNKRQ